MRLHEQLPLEIQDRDGRPVFGLDDREAAPGRGGREVRRPHDPLRGLEVRRDLAAPPDVVAEREHVRAGREQALREPRRDPGAVRDVLAVDDAEADAVLLLQRRQPFLYGLAAGRAEHVGYEEDDQGRESVAG